MPWQIYPQRPSLWSKFVGVRKACWTKSAERMKPLIFTGPFISTGLLTASFAQGPWSYYVVLISQISSKTNCESPSKSQSIMFLHFKSTAFLNTTATSLFQFYLLSYLGFEIYPPDYLFLYLTLNLWMVSFFKIYVPTYLVSNTYCITYF